MSETFLAGFDDDNQTIVGSLSPPSEGARAASPQPDSAGLIVVEEDDAADEERFEDTSPEVISTLREGRRKGPHGRPATARHARVRVDTPPEVSLPYEETLFGRRPQRPPNDRVGSVIAGRYRIVRVIGEGGMGTVFEAVHLELRKRVAIKILCGLFAGHDEASARFLREARAASAVESDHIVQVFDVGEDLDAGLYMVMELLTGEDLAKRIRTAGRLPSEEAAGIALQVSRALERAHGAGVVHRDLKPANIFLTRVDDGSIKVKVLDFGIAKLVREANDSRRGITRQGTAIGTAQYMSPEQAQGLDSVDGATDMYSLGALLHECLTGVPPYPDLDSYEQTILKILTEPPPRLSSLVAGSPSGMEALIASMMARDPRGRPASFARVRAKLMAMHPGIESRRLVLGAPPAAVAVREEPVRTGGGVTVESSDPARHVSTVPPARGRDARRTWGALGVLGALAAAASFVIGSGETASMIGISVPYAGGLAVAVQPPETPDERAPAPPSTGASMGPMTVQVSDLPRVGAPDASDHSPPTVQVTDLPRVR